MMTIRQLGRVFGLSRATLLYYDRIGLLRPAARSDTGYRLYDEESVNQLRLIRTYKDAGLTLKEIRVLLQTDTSPGRNLLKRRILELDDNIAGLRLQQRALLAMLRNTGDDTFTSVISKQDWVGILRTSGMSEGDMDRWHAAFERNAPRAHHAFLRWLGIPEKDARKIRSNAKPGK